MSLKDFSHCLGVPLFLLTGIANCGVLTTPISDSLWVANDESSPVAIAAVPAGNASTTPLPSWGVSQWDGPVPLTYPYTQTLYPNGNWALANSSASVQYDNTTQPWLGSVYTLAQNGAGLACNPSPNMEYDLFLGPKSDEAMGSNAQSAPYGMTASQPLSSLQALSFNLGLEIKYEQIGSYCGINQAGYVLGFLFRNISTTPAKAFFYQIYFRRPTRVGGTVVLGQPNAELFIDTDGNVGVDDHISNVASGLQAPVPGSSRIAYSTNILPRLVSIIQSGGPNGNSFDPNLSHYVLTGTYFGQNVWGDSLTTASWDNFNIATAP